MRCIATPPDLGYRTLDSPGPRVAFRAFPSGPWRFGGVAMTTLGTVRTGFTRAQPRSVPTRGNSWPSVNSSVNEISLAVPRGGRDSLRSSAECAELSRKQSRNRSIPTLASFECDPFGIRYNVTLDGCCDHRAISADEDLHRHAVENLNRVDALLFGRVTYEMMEAAFRSPART